MGAIGLNDRAISVKAKFDERHSLGFSLIEAGTMTAAAWRRHLLSKLNGIHGWGRVNLWLNHYQIPKSGRYRLSCPKQGSSGWKARLRCSDQPVAPRRRLRGSWKRCAPALLFERNVCRAFASRPRTGAISYRA